MECVVPMDNLVMQCIPVVVRPQCHKARISIWTHISVSEMETLRLACTTETVKKELATIFHLEDHECNPKSAALLDTLFYALQFARESGFADDQTAAFMSMLKQTHDICVETPFGNIDHCFSFFRDIVMTHVVQRPPFSIQLFSAEEGKRITEYVVNTYFRHYKLYKYVFTPNVTLDLSICYPGIPETPQPSLVGDAEPVIEEPHVETACEKLEEELVQQESEAASELRQIIRNHLIQEMTKFRLCIEERLEQTAKDIDQKLVVAEVKSEPPEDDGKARKGDKKGKDKKGSKTPDKKTTK